ncbi:unnamed protein product [Anisakis simplex]|uniref:Uncharacterized protein n=1 Tax=Anisakis simplex TaxID=6269 RepID=A0A0M3JLK5_ANISI|nr:unnamed protein product [Anisakis simplex]
MYSSRSSDGHDAPAGANTGSESSKDGFRTVHRILLGVLGCFVSFEDGQGGAQEKEIESSGDLGLVYRPASKAVRMAMKQQTVGAA